MAAVAEILYIRTDSVGGRMNLTYQSVVAISHCCHNKFGDNKHFHFIRPDSVGWRVNLTTHSLERNGRVVNLLFGFTSKVWFEEKASDQVSVKHQTDYKTNQTKDKNCLFVGQVMFSQQMFQSSLMYSKIKRSLTYSVSDIFTYWAVLKLCLDSIKKKLFVSDWSQIWCLLCLWWFHRYYCIFLPEGQATSLHAVVSVRGIVPEDAHIVPFADFSLNNRI